MTIVPGSIVKDVGNRRRELILYKPTLFRHEDGILSTTSPNVALIRLTEELDQIVMYS
jgi:hypothetical protein